MSTPTPQKPYRYRSSVSPMRHRLYSQRCKSKTASRCSATSRPFQSNRSDYSRRSSARRSDSSQRVASASSLRRSNRQNRNDSSDFFSARPTSVSFLSAKNGFIQSIFYAVGSFLIAILHLFVALLKYIALALMFLFRMLYSLMSRSRIALVTCIAAVVLLVAGLADFGLNADKIYSGVTIGDIEVSGKTIDEAEALVSAAYAARLDEGSVIIYASEEAQSRLHDELKKVQDRALAEQLAVEEAQNNKLAWTVDACSLAAIFPARAIAEQAFQVGRENGGFLTRIGALLTGYAIKPYAAYDDELLEQLACDIDSVIGYARVDCDVEIKDGVAQAVEGHAGYMINRDKLRHLLDEAFFSQGDDKNSFIAFAEDAPLRIDLESAQAVATALNGALVDGARFTYEGVVWNATAADIGAWVDTRVDTSEDRFVLVPYIDLSKARSSLLLHIEKTYAFNPVHIAFEVNGDSVTVHADAASTMPSVSEAAQQLDAALFGSNGKIHKLSEDEKAPVEISVVSGSVPEVLSLEDAFELGLVDVLASYTTEFTTGAGTENRNHNIELVSQILSNSVVSPNNIWSFNETAGECNEERGFLNAGAILDGEYSDAVGGGICQVATTIFNAVYESGLPIISRHNHSLYIPSYPAGRDAAVSWPDLDFQWKNDTAGDVLLCLSCAKGSLTATLYGVDCGYQVVSTTGEWGEGSAYSTKIIVDESLAPDTSYIKTRGTDGREITVTRTVKDENNSVLREDVFSSVYNPMTEIVVKGPDADVEDKNA